jgi:hypothetical protein
MQPRVSLITIGVADLDRSRREGAETSWGGYSGMFIDPDGRPWEVAHKPFWNVSDEGDVRLG